MKLPGLPANKRALNRRIAQEGWADRADCQGVRLARKCKGRGGGMEYHLVLLPSDTRLELSRRQPTLMQWSNSDSDGPRAASWKWFDRQPQKVREEAQRRLLILKEVVILRENGATWTAAIATIARDRSVGMSTLWNWLRLVRGCSRHDWPPALAPRWRNKTAKPKAESLDKIIAEVLRLKKRLNYLEKLLGLTDTKH